MKCKDQLPPFGKYVIAAHNLHTWIDSTDQENVNKVIVKRIPAQIGGNNEVPYQWDTFGPQKFFGQEITDWCEIPKL